MESGLQLVYFHIIDEHLSGHCIGDIKDKIGTAILIDEADSSPFIRNIAEHDSLIDIPAGCHIICLSGLNQQTAKCRSFGSSCLEFENGYVTTITGKVKHRSIDVRLSAECTEIYALAGGISAVNTPAGNLCKLGEHIGPGILKTGISIIVAKDLLKIGLLDRTIFEAVEVLVEYELELAILGDFAQILVEGGDDLLGGNFGKGHCCILFGGGSFRYHRLRFHFIHTSALGRSEAEKRQCGHREGHACGESRCK